MESLSNVLKQSNKDESTRTVVRGKVTKIGKFNLLKKEQKYYFHLEGTISDGSDYLDVAFSSKVLEKIIGMTTSEFTQKRREAKAHPEIKDQLRLDLDKAEKILRNLDAFLELELRKNEKALIVANLGNFKSIKTLSAQMQ